MIDTEHYNLRQLFLDFIDIGEDEAQWKCNLEIYDGLLAEVLRLRDEPRITIDEWDKVLGSEHTGPYVTLYLEGKEYIGALRLYKDEEGKVIE